MDKIRRFVRDKAVILVVAACIVCAACTGIWAVRTIRQNQTPLQDGTSGADDAGLEEYPGMMEDDNAWQQDMGVAGNAAGVPEETPNATSNDGSGSASSSSVAQSSGTGQKKSGEPAAAGAPSCTQPVSGSVVKAYSGDNLVYSKTLDDWRTHNGTDFACSSGENVYAPVSGTVSNATVDGNWGGVVEIADGEGRVWRLCGVSDATVKQGDAVVTGQQIGTAGTIGCEHSDGTHIHMEISKDETYLDPATLLG